MTSIKKIYQSQVQCRNEKKKSSSTLCYNKSSPNTDAELDKTLSAIASSVKGGLLAKPKVEHSFASTSCERTIPPESSCEPLLEDSPIDDVLDCEHQEIAEICEPTGESILRIEEEIDSISPTQTLQSSVNPANVVTTVDSPVLLNINDLGNNRISATYQIGDKTKTVNLPKYMYHFTNGHCHESIQNDRCLCVSDYDEIDLSGLYMVGAKNFFENCIDVTLQNGKSINILHSILCKTATSTKDKDDVGYVYQIPTSDLLANGDVRIRSHKDYFNIVNKLKEIDKIVDGVYEYEGVCDPVIRSEFIQDVKSHNLMSDKELDDFLRDVDKKVGQGYDIFEAYAGEFEEKEPIEYVYVGENLQLDKFPNIRAVPIRFFDFVYPDCMTVKIDEFKKFFDENLEQVS